MQRKNNKTLISLIVAMDENNGIGYKQDIPWYLPHDLYWFKQNTLGKIIVMGRETWDGLKIKPLPKRKNIILTRKKGLSIENVEVINDWKKVLDIQANEVCITGGAEIYRLFLDFVDKIYLTRIKHQFKVDTYFNDLNLSLFEQTFIQENKKSEHAEYDYQFEIYQRKIDGK